MIKYSIYSIISYKPHHIQPWKVSNPELEEISKEVDTSYIERKLYEQLHGKKTPITKKATDSLLKMGDKIGKNLTSKK